MVLTKYARLSQQYLAVLMLRFVLAVMCMFSSDGTPANTTVHIAASTWCSVDV